MKTVVLVAVVVALSALSACGCVQNESGKTSQEHYTTERDAACAAVEGCDAQFVADVPLYESADPVADGCDEGAVGCFCHNPGCSGSIVIADQDQHMKNCAEDDWSNECVYSQQLIAMHEYVHAAYKSIGKDTHNHGPEFDAALIRAFKIWRKMQKAQH